MLHSSFGYLFSGQLQIINFVFLFQGYVCQICIPLVYFDLSMQNFTYICLNTVATYICTFTITSAVTYLYICVYQSSVDIQFCRNSSKNQQYYDNCADSFHYYNYTLENLKIFRNIIIIKYLCTMYVHYNKFNCYLYICVYQSAVDIQFCSSSSKNYEYYHNSADTY